MRIYIRLYQYIYVLTWKATIAIPMALKRPNLETSRGDETETSGSIWHCDRSSTLISGMRKSLSFPSSLSLSCLQFLYVKYVNIYKKISGKLQAFIRWIDNQVNILPMVFVIIHFEISFSLTGVTGVTILWRGHSMSQLTHLAVNMK